MSKERKNRKVGKIYENKLPSGKSILNLSISKSYQAQDGSTRGGRVLFEDAETGEIYEIKAATVFEVTREGDKALFDVVVDLANDYQVEKLG
jgi:hypothetical protein